MSIDQMITLLRRAREALPEAQPSEVFLSAACMAEAIEGMSNGGGRSVATRKGAAATVLTAARLRELGLEYSSVANAAHDLVDVKKMSLDAAAKRMGATRRQVMAALNNYRNRASKKPAGVRAAS